MITDAIKKKQNHRDNLIADYHKTLLALEEKKDKIAAAIEAAIEETDYRKVAKLEREQTDNQVEIDDIKKAIGWAEEKLALRTPFVREQWGVRQADHEQKLAKALDNANKAFGTFAACLAEIKKIKDAAYDEAQEYQEIARSEDPVFKDNNLSHSLSFLSPMLSPDTVYGLYTEYSQKL